MLLISHRGNLNGPQPELENSEGYISKALGDGFEVEIDVWSKGSEIFLGHNQPTYQTSLEFLNKHKEKLWMHCKNLDALNFMLSQTGFNFFWHETDDYTLTSKGFIWTYFEKPVAQNNVLVVKGQIKKDDLPDCYGVCSDYAKILSS